MPLNAGAAGILPDSDNFAEDLEAQFEGGCALFVDAWTAEYAGGGYAILPDTLTVEGWEVTAEQMLSCALYSGNIHFWMLPYFVNNVLEFVIGLAGLIAVLMILVGAYYYIAGGISEDKEKGKTIIKYAIGGFVLVLASWTLVNVLLLFLTT